MLKHKQKIKIALVTYSMNSGGVEMFLLRLGKYFISKKIHVDIIVTEEKGAWFNKIGQNGINSIKIPISRVWNFFPFPPLLFPFLINNYLKANGYNVIFLNHSKYVQVLLNIFDKGEVIFSILHNHEPSVYKIGLANRNLLNKIVAVGNKIFFEATEQSTDSKVVLIQNGVELPQNSQVKEFKEINKLNLLYIGRLENLQKGIFLLPTIIKNCKDLKIHFELTIAGDGKDSKELMQRFSKLNLEKNEVKFLGSIDNDELVNKLYQQSHLLLMPSNYEGLPITALEAQAYGCVPIATFLPGITDTCIVDKSTGLLIQKGDVDGFVNAINYFYENLDTLKIYSENAKQWISKEYSINIMGDKYLNLILNELKAPALSRSKKINFKEYFSLFIWKDYLPLHLKHILKKLIAYINSV